MVKERIKGNLDQPGEPIKIEYRFRNSSMKYPLSDVVFNDQLPKSVEVVEINQKCLIEKLADFKILTCVLGGIKPKERGKIIINVVADIPLEKEIFEASEVKTDFKSTNVLTSFEFTAANYLKVFSASEFTEVLKTTIYYTFFGTAGALILGLFAAQIMQKTFPGRAVVRGILLLSLIHI